MKKLAIVTSHPIQYNAPWFRMLTQREKIYPKVFYTWDQSKSGNNFDPGFGKKVEWDIPLLEGYEYTFVKNVSKNPGSHHFSGIINPSLNQEIKAWQPDAILVITWAHKSHLNCMRFFHKRIPVLFRGDSTLLNETSGIKKIVRKLFLKWVYTYVNFGMYVGKNNKAYYLRHGMKEKELVFTPHAIDNKRFSEHELEYRSKATAWRQSLQIPESATVFLFAGKLEPVKDAALLIAAFRTINNRDIHLIMVGNGPLENEIRSANPAGANLHFIAFQNQSVMPIVYHLCDVFVLPSKSESWGLAINEAMACKKAVLVSDKCGAAVDLVRDGENGFVFESGNMQDLVEKMEKLYENKNLLQAFGKQSFQIISGYSFERICESVERVVTKDIT